MTVKGGTSQACAACKYQRRKCKSDCQLAPYFPPDQPKQFQNAHRLFGVSNIHKTLNKLDPVEKVEAMRSIIYQANMREKYPVQGCVGVIHTLLFLIHRTRQELEFVLGELSKYQQRDQIHQHHLRNSSPPTSQLALFNPSFSDGGSYNNTVNPLWVQLPAGFPPFNDKNNGNGNLAATVETHMQQQQEQEQEQQQHYLLTTTAANDNSNMTPPPPPEYDEISPFFDTIDDRQSYIDSKEAYESSSESSLIDTTQTIKQVMENELKSAAACFSLTNIVN